MIVKRGNEYCLLTKDGSRTLGCHPTRAEAIKQEAAIKAAQAAKAGEMTEPQAYADGEPRPVRAFLTKLRDLLKSKVSEDDFKAAIKTARSHAGGKTPTKPKEEPKDLEKIAADEEVDDLPRHEPSLQGIPEKYFGDIDNPENIGYPIAKLEKMDPRVKYKAATAGGDVCGGCRFFVSPEACRLVEGAHEKAYTCKLFTARPALFQEGDAGEIAELEAFIDSLEPQEFAKIPPQFLKNIKKKKDSKDDDEDDKKKKKKLPPWLQNKLKGTELYDYLEFYGEQDHRSDWRLFLELSGDPEWIPYLPKPGSYKHPRYGAVSITRKRNDRFIKNFNDKVYQETLPIDAEHNPKTSGAMGWVVGMRANENGSADAKVEWTDRGRDMLKKDRFRYFSPEWYNVWEDPSTSKKHFDVAIGGALTTRPFFKEGALRALVACEDALFAPVDGTVFSRTEEKKMSEEGKEKDDGTQDQKVVDPQTFEELVDSNRKLTERLEAQDKHLQQATEKVTKLTADAQRKRFTDIVLGKDADVGGHRWFGEPEKHVSFMEKIADKFGADSEEIKQYVEQQKAYAEQLEQSQIFTTIGSDGGGAPLGSSDAGSEFIALAEKRFNEKTANDKNQSFTLADAMSEIAAEKPELYNKYNEESTIKV